MKLNAIAVEQALGGGQLQGVILYQQQA